MSSTARIKSSSGRIRKRPVSFGNPSLGTYHGSVYTSETRSSSLLEGAVPSERLVAMVEVPPEQVPEGVLNLARSHRPWIDHVRIVIEDEGKQQQQQQHPNKNEAPEFPSLTASVFENAASILAAEQQSDALKTAHHNDHNKTPTPYSRSYLVLFELSTEAAADELVECLHGQPYTCLDAQQTCSLYHVVALEGEDGVSLMSPFFAPATKTTDGGGFEILPSDSGEADDHPSDDYNCAVCLEHMQLDRTAVNSERPSILTTVCNHSFHMDCLLKWQDSPCPVCRYDHSGLNETLSQCHVCGTTESNFVCLICGVVSCGNGGGRRSIRSDMEPRCQSEDSADTPAAVRMSSSHARQHYDETLHAYALDTESQHVWDFAGQGYVHRLLQNKDDGKLVEVGDPANTTSQERSLAPGLSDAQEGEVVHRKLEGFASQYYTLLKSQLEQQRIYYEGRLEEIRREHELKGDRPPKRTSDLIVALKQERHQLSQRLTTLQAKCSKVRDDVAFLKSMNESLEANKVALKKDLERAQRDRFETNVLFDECLPPLQEKVTTLMLQLESETSRNEGQKPAAT